MHFFKKSNLCFSERSFWTNYAEGFVLLFHQKFANSFAKVVCKIAKPLGISGRKMHFGYNSIVLCIKTKLERFAKQNRMWLLLQWSWYLNKEHHAIAMSMLAFVKWFLQSLTSHQNVSKKAFGPYKSSIPSSITGCYPGSIYCSSVPKETWGRRPNSSLFIKWKALTY